MQLSELKLVTASNLISLRIAAGMTQAELGARLNYSDKSVSKWERGEAIPDVYVLTQMAEIFGVTVDYIVSSHDDWEAPQTEEERKPQYSAGMIMAVAVLSIVTMALTVFVAMWLFEIIWWPIFVIAVPVSLLAIIIMLCIFKRTDYLQYVVAAFVFSLFALVYVLMLPLGSKWQLFLIAAPAVALVFLSFNIRIKPRKKRRKSTEKE